MDKSTQDQLVSEDNARTLMAARRVLVEIGRRTTSADEHDDVSLAWRLGLLHQAADAAESAIFEALSTASSMLDVPAARQAAKRNIYA